MKITNEFNLPLPFVDAVSFDDYMEGQEPSDFSTTGLIRPARIAALSKRHRDNMTEDASERVWGLSGQTKHVVLERIAKQNPERYLAEHRLYADFEGYRLSGQVDLLDNNDLTLYDWKETSIWKIVMGDNEEWTQQANINYWLAARNGIEIKKLCNIAFLKDWKKRQAVKKDYPPAPIQACPLSMWPFAKTEDYIRERIRAHKEAEIDPPLCTPSERWEIPPKFALMKKGRKRAIKLYDSKEQAEAGLSNEREQGKCYVEDRPGENVRCLYYCPVVAFCGFGRNLIQEQAE